MDRYVYVRIYMYVNGIYSVHVAGDLAGTVYDIVCTLYAEV